jgi:CubicO group peptidase (beta-lactamase class C family)
MTIPAIQKSMQQFLQSVVREGRERGVQLAVYLDGRLIVDAWAGVADPTTGRPVERDTLFPVFSVTKGLAATLLHRLVERGRVTYDTPIARVWPEFAAHGKENILVRHALNHTAGLPFLPVGLGYADLADWDRMCAVIADLPPAWTPGSQRVYHAVTYSWLVGEVCRRVDGRPFARMLRDEICRPLGLADMYVGIPDEVESRVALLDEVFEPGKEPHVDDTQPQSVPGWLQPLHTMMNRPDARRACIPASNGIMTARDLARHYAALVPGGVDGVELLPPRRVQLATELQPPWKNPDGADAPRIALGYALMDRAVWGEELSPGAFCHGGYGGSIGFADPHHRLAVGLAKNFFSPSGAQVLIVRRLIEELGLKP